MVREAPKIVISDNEVPILDFKVKTIQWYISDGHKFLHQDYYESFGFQLSCNLWPEQQFKTWVEVLKYLGIE